MGKLFGTDGIRGIVGENLTVELAFHVGQAVAAVLTEEKGSKPTITIGKDTRISSDMLEAALMAGICSVGGDVMPLGTIPTPAVAYLTVLEQADAGLVGGRRLVDLDHQLLDLALGLGHVDGEVAHLRLDLADGRGQVLVGDPAPLGHVGLGEVVGFFGRLLGIGVGGGDDHTGRGGGRAQR